MTLGTCYQAHVVHTQVPIFHAHTTQLYLVVADAGFLSFLRPLCAAAVRPPVLPENTVNIPL